ncbi:MAG: HEPN domain-containing protein [Heliobacteriaceae bacterium]|jgi:uncharacterized protein (UPF0332 family)|nr:HEPN domain-containing protein [Heliobacteriaceae bacterium]
MPQQRKEIVITRNIEKSHEAIETAEENIANNRLFAALNRIYYAIFYIVTALAKKNDFVTSKHAKLMGWFNKKFVYEDKIFDPEMLEIYKMAFAHRQDSDYDVMYTPDLEKTTELLSDVKKFIGEVEKFIQKG